MDGIYVIRSAFEVAIAAVKPDALIKKMMSVNEKSCLEIKTENVSVSFNLNKNVYIVGFGKAACGMAMSVEGLLKSHIRRAIISIPVGTFDLFRANGPGTSLPPTNSVIQYREGAKNNIPDKDSFKAAVEIKNLCSGLKESDILLVLISGGGSALLPCPSSGITLDEEVALIKLLSTRGADIVQLNTVRQKISELKGGGLAILAKPAKVRLHRLYRRFKQVGNSMPTEDSEECMSKLLMVVALIISDVIGNNMQIIASGPTVQSSYKADDALEVIKKFCKPEEIPKSVMEHLSKNASAPLLDSSAFSHVTNVLIGDNRLALDACKNHLERMYGVDCLILSTSVAGEAAQVGIAVAQFLNKVVEVDNRDKFDWLKAPFCQEILDQKYDELRIFLMERLLKKNFKFALLFGGETTVTVRGVGRGGRNQEMVLAFAIKVCVRRIYALSEIDFAFASMGTDGQDGPTDAAGAIVTKSLLGRWSSKRIVKRMRARLIQNDSYNFFSEVESAPFVHFKPGFTGTNVSDMQILLVYK